MNQYIRPSNYVDSHPATQLTHFYCHMFPANRAIHCGGGGDKKTAAEMVRKLN